MRMVRLRPLLALCALLAAFVVIAGDVDARPRMSFGSRGSKTFSAPPPTQTAPNAVRPMDRTMTQPQARPNTATRPTTAPTGGLFGRPGFFGGLAAGFLGAGLIGLLLGHGFLGGLGGLASLFGLLLQVGLIVIVARLLWSWWQRRSQPAFAGGPMLRDASSSQSAYRGGLGGSAASASGSDTVALTGADFDQFERVLGEVQTAYGREDLGSLRSRVTPEMLSYLSEELAQNARRGVVNKISDVKLLQGDLSEAWREGSTEYATVAMRYSLDDRMVDRSTGRVVEGGPDQAAEVWTFRREPGGAWLVSAIQQVD
jgi:predicted lipid-binding transport protein (Tim44 family)